jgi:hypothetical protein
MLLKAKVANQMPGAWQCTAALMKSLLWHTPIVLKKMIRWSAFILVGCVVCAGLILIEIGSISSHRPSPGARLPSAEIKSAAPEIRKLADPLFSPTQRRPETASSANDADSPLRDVRLTGVVIGPDLRIAVFAVTGTNSSGFCALDGSCSPPQHEPKPPNERSSSVLHGRLKTQNPPDGDPAGRLLSLNL